jgi:hypothetical protein
MRYAIQNCKVGAVVEVEAAREVLFALPSPPAA